MTPEETQQLKKMEQQNKELRLYAEQLDARLKNLEQSKSVLPTALETKPFEDIATYNLLKVLKLYAGIPIYTTTTNLKGFDGQIFLINASANTAKRKVVGFQIGSTVSVVAVT